MNGAFYIGATGLEVQQRNLDVIAQNVANVNTNAYKRAEMRFAELVNVPPVAPDAAPLARGATDAAAGVAVAGTARIFAQGDLRQTDRPFDLAISGDGFLEVAGPGGQTWLWRGGGLKIGTDGLLQTADGMPLKNAIEVPRDVTELRIERDGRVRGLAAGDTDYTELGQLDVVMPDDVTRLEAVDGGYFRAPDGVDVQSYVPGEQGKGVLVQGSVEASNVELTTELVGLMLAQRAYGANAQVVQAGDQLMAIANGLRR
ncbi:MAG: flagellar hook-basal body protein [Sphingomonadales bacterium]|nr:flagellar hook-basal body protein [Sphingomonadales bacterium]